MSDIYLYPHMNRKLTGLSVPVEKLFFSLWKKKYERVNIMAIRVVEFSSRGRGSELEIFLPKN